MATTPIKAIEARKEYLSKLDPKNTPTPDRSVEEIVEEFCSILNSIPNIKTVVDEDTHVGIQDTLRETLQAERQKQEEMVQAERERIAKILLSDPNKIVQIVGKTLTQPNNPTT